jgi:hypothetical protein
MALRQGAKALHTSAAARALPALSAAPKSSGFLGLFGGSAPTMPSMTEPLAGVAVPPYTEPVKAAATTQKKLANGAIIAAEDTPVRFRRSATRAAAGGARCRRRARQRVCARRGSGSCGVVVRR